MYVSPPDELSRAQIIDLQLSKVPHDANNMDVAAIVRATKGFSGAEVVAAVAEASMLAIDDECTQVTQRHIELSIAAVQPQITADMIAFYDKITAAW